MKRTLYCEAIEFYPSCNRDLFFKKIRLLLLVLCISGIPISKSFAFQQRHISGTITDANTGESLPGVSILIEGTVKGTISDIDGNYSIDLSENEEVLVFSFLGYVTENLPVGGTMSSLNVQLVPDITAMEEVVVVGYGTMKKKDLTGSITQVDASKLENENPNSVQDLLRGIPGLNVGLSSDAKGGGSLQIRGQRSVYTDGDHNAPLIVLDGMVFYGELSEINPDDIDRIDVLKDASAASVYGAKSANGVVIISTKRGKTGKPRITFSASTGLSTMGANREVYGPEGYLQFYEDWYTTKTYGVNNETGEYEAYQTTQSSNPGYYSYPSEENLAEYGITIGEWRSYTNNEDGISDKEIWASSRLGLSDYTLDNYLAGKTFDWYDHSFRTGINQDYNINLSGGTENVSYYLSAGYLSNEGVVVGNDYSTVRSNMKINAKVNNRISIGANVNFQNRTDGDLAVDWYDQIIYNSPFATYKNEDGELEVHPMGDRSYAMGYNYDFNRQYLALEKGYTVLNSIFNAKIELPFNITYSFNYSPRFQFFYDRYWESADHPDWEGTNGLVNRQHKKWFDWCLNNTINWDYTLANKHHFNVTLVQEAEERQYWFDAIYARDITPTDALGFHETANANTDESSFDTDDTHETADGLLGRLFYSYNDKYMITGSVRRDGYSAFGTSNPRATFFSLAVAWTFSNEEFFVWEPMSLGKLRLSWGQNGNRSLENPYLALANLSLGTGTQGYYTTSGDYEQFQTLKVDRLANTNLEWEKTTALNAALDLGFYNNRFTGTIDYYYMPTNDMIMDQQLPDFSGFSSITCNLGEVVNTGIELSLTSNNMVRDNFTWSTTFNFSYYKNKIKHLYYKYEYVYDEDGNIISETESDDVDNGWFIGKPISAIWDYEVTGIWQKDEVEEAALYGQVPGDPKVANHYTDDDTDNGDGNTTPVYNNSDKVFLGQESPPIHWSIRNNFTIFKNIDFSFNIYSYWGHKSTSTEYLNNENNKSEITNNYNVYVKEYWTVDNATNDYARLDAAGPTGLSSPVKAIDRSFIRLESIAISYNLPQTFLSKLKIEQFKVYGNIRNVAVWNKEWEYWDSETYDKYDDNPELTGLAPRIYTLGIKLTL